MARKKPEAGAADGIALPLEWHVPEGTTSRYATNMTVQRGEHEYIITFWEAFPPMLIGPPEVVKDALEKMGAVRAECIARVIVARDRMPNFVATLKDFLEQQQKLAMETAE